MSRWTWLALGVVFVAGAVTLWHSYQLNIRTLSGLEPKEPEPKLLALSTAPSLLFLGASLLRRRSRGMQWAVMLLVVQVGVLRVYCLRDELSRPWSRMEGLEAGLGWLAGMIVAGVTLLVAVILAARAVVRNAPPMDDEDDME